MTGLVVFILMVFGPSFEAKPQKRQPVIRQCESKELTNKILLNTAQLPEFKALVYLKEVKVKKGDKLIIQVNAEVTNDLGFNTMLVWYVQKTLNGKVYILNQKTGTNVTPAQHHYSPEIVRLDEIQEDGLVKYEFIMYAASTLEKKGNFLTIEECYGSMNIMKVGI